MLKKMKKRQREWHRCDVCDELTAKCVEVTTNAGIPLVVDMYCLSHIEGVSCEGTNGCFWCVKHPTWKCWKKEGGLYCPPDGFSDMMADKHDALAKSHSLSKWMWKPTPAVTWADTIGQMLFFMSHPSFQSVRDDPKVMDCIRRQSHSTSFEEIANIVAELKAYEKTANMFFNE